MTRNVKRSFDRNYKFIDKVVKKVTLKKLKLMGVDFVLRADNTIVSDRNKDVENVYNTTMVEVIAMFNRVGGSVKLLKKLYNMK